MSIEEFTAEDGTPVPPAVVEQILNAYKGRFNQQHSVVHNADEYALLVENSDYNKVAKFVDKDGNTLIDLTGTVTVRANGASSEVVNINSTQTLTNKTIDGSQLVDDSVDWTKLAFKQVAGRAARSSTQGLSETGSDTTVSFDAQTFATDGYTFWSNSNATRLLLPAIGIWVIVGTVDIDDTTEPKGQAQAWFAFSAGHTSPTLASWGAPDTGSDVIARKGGSLAYIYQTTADTGYVEMVVYSHNNNGTSDMELVAGASLAAALIAPLS